MKPPGKVWIAICIALTFLIFASVAGARKPILWIVGLAILGLVLRSGDRIGKQIGKLERL